jgi:hypothetical protein
LIAGVEAALRWQAENPQVPTGDQIEELISEYYRETNSVSFVRSIVVEWQRQMYIAPEALDGMFRCDFDEDNNQVVTRNGKILFYVCGKDCAKQAASGLNDEFNPGWKNKHKLPEVPEEIKDLMAHPSAEIEKETTRNIAICQCERHNRDVIEAYRRGQKAGRL